jgi:hypothetical protein
MRFLIELGLVGALVGMTWNQSLQGRYDEWTGTTKAPAHVQYLPKAAPTSTGQWMWDPHHRSPLDRPAFQSTHTSEQDKR